MKLGQNKLTGSNFDFSFLTLLPPSVGWYILGYELDPLPSYVYLSKRSYTVNFKCYIHLQVTLPHFPRTDTSTVYP